MARPPRLDVIFQRHSDPIWFVTINTAEREPWLNDTAVHIALQGFATRGYETGRAVIGGYVLMPDHLHLLVRLASDQVLGEWVKALKAVLVRASGPKAGRWQQGFFDHLLRKSESYAEKWDYVRMNPVRAGLAKQPEDWPLQGEFHPIYFD